MSGINELEIDRPGAKSPSLSLLKTTETKRVGALERTPCGLERQYIPSKTFHIDDNVEPARSGSSRNLLGIIKINLGAGLPRSHTTIDLLITILCFVLIHVYYSGDLDFTSYKTIAFSGSLLFIILSLSASGIYSTKRLRSLNRELAILLICWISTFAAVGLFSVITSTAADGARMWLSTSMVATLASLGSVRILSCLRFQTKQKEKSRNIIVCGNASYIKPVLRHLYKFPDSDIRVAKVFEFSAQQAMEATTSNSLPAATQEIVHFIENQRQRGCAVEQVWIAASTNQAQIADVLSQTLIDSSVDVCVASDPFTERLLAGDITRVGEVSIVNVSEIFLSPAAENFKRVFDILFASAALLALCIPMLIIACLIKIESPGPALFRQKRYGIDGKDIEILKFRSMCVHTDSHVRQATRNDARITRFGKVLRRTSLDELPQFLNVLFGSMSLIGPRPHAVAHNEMWRKQIKGYMLRHKVRPGITGLAQVKGWRGETDTAFKMQQRVKFDLEYIRIWSPWLDIKIIFLTIFKGFSNKNAY